MRSFPNPFHVAAGLGVSILLVAMCVWVLVARGAAPVLSANLTFNGKAAYLRGALARGCDVLVEGSSVAQLSIDGPELRAALGRRVVNTGYNGASPGESLIVYRAVRTRCRPAILVLPLQYVDLQSETNAANDWTGFARYISAGSMTPVYLRRWTLNLMWSRLKNSPLDESGGSLWSCVTYPHPEAFQARYLERPMPAIRSRDLEPIASLLRTAIGEGVRVYVIRLPLPSVVERVLETPLADRFWNAIHDTVAANGAGWIDLKNRGAYADDEFRDFLHLNSCGARRATGEIARVIQAAPR